MLRPAPFAHPRTRVQRGRGGTRAPPARGSHTPAPDDSRDPPVPAGWVQGRPGSESIAFRACRISVAHALTHWYLQKDLADALAPLTSLRTLKLHLNFAHMPFPDFGTGCRGISRFHDMTFDAHRRFDDTLVSTAGEFSRALGPSLEEIWMYAASDDPAWIIFVVTHIVRDGEVQIGVVRKDKHKHWYRA